MSWLAVLLFVFFSVLVLVIWLVVRWFRLVGFSVVVLDDAGPSRVQVAGVSKTR